MVFFKDGLIKNHKYRTWIKRQNARYHDSYEVLSCVYSGCSVDDILQRCLNKLEGMATVIPVVEEMAAKHGNLIFSLSKECDVEMARYANKHNVLAILSEDSDFLIFKGKWKLWSIYKLYAETLKTCESSRKALRKLRKLSLNDDQLSILPTIAGNDMIEFESIEKAIGKNFRFTPKFKFPKIANYIKQNVSCDINTRSHKIADLMFGNKKPATLKLVEESLMAYRAVSGIFLLQQSKLLVTH